MTTRSYRQGRRQEAADRTRARIVRAARDLLLAPRLGAEFSLEAIARKARVTRRTVYLQFGSRRALVEAAFDAMAERGGMTGIALAMGHPDPREAISRTVATFGHFWTMGRLGIRRVRAHAEFDAELASAMQERNERRRKVFGALVQRLSATIGSPKSGKVREVVALLFALTSFEMFDSLAGPDRTPDEVTPLIQGLVDRVLDGE